MESIGKNAKPIELPLVEDSPSDVRLTREAFQDARVHVNLNVVSDGAEAMAFLNREGKHAESPRPDLILLDLNLKVEIQNKPRCFTAVLRRNKTVGIHE
jgi:chemotaxis family two-component system response regulator Rcp1